MFFSILHIFHNAHVILSSGRTVNIIFRSPFECSTLNIFLDYLYQVVHWAHQETKKSAFFAETLIFKIMIMIAHICIRCDCFETLSHLIIWANLQMRQERVAETPMSLQKVISFSFLGSDTWYFPVSLAASLAVEWAHNWVQPNWLWAKWCVLV